jgi:NAD(P)-dependent dehydrogenase (short-subunit alcohol dehydrogenase family)
MKHVLVTGAGGGLGACTCDLLASRGTTVFATDSSRRSLGRWKAAPGVIALPMDVTDGRSVARACGKVAALTDGLDGLVCCAGIFAGGPLVEADEKEMIAILDINVLGAFRVVKELFPLLERRGGTIVLIGSESSRCAMPFNGPYTVSKYALQAYADVLRRELMFLGVKVTVVQPGAIRTSLLSGARSTIERREAAGTAFPTQLGLVRRMLSREWEKGMQPGRVAGVVARALGARTARPFYRVGNDPVRAALGRLPASWADSLIRWFLPVSSAAPLQGRRSARTTGRAQR